MENNLFIWHVAVRSEGDGDNVGATLGDSDGDDVGAVDGNSDGG